MARNKFDVDERLETPFQWKHLKRAGAYIGRHKFQMIAALVGRVCADEALPSPQVGARALDQPCFELDAGLALHWQGRVLAQFTPDDCISQMERRCLFV